jgi:glycosyltransferase involved in cell wall biosynthesis
MPYAGPLLAARAGRGTGSTGGAETQIFLLARELVARGHRVAIATFQVPAGLPEEVDGVRVVALPARAGGRARLGLLLWGVRFLTAVARIERCIVVQRGAGALTGLAALIARVRRSPFVYSSANVIDFEYGRLERNRWALRLFGLGRRLARSIVVQSDEQAALCRRHWGRPATVIRSLAEPAPPRSGPPEAFLWIGRLAPYKRPELVLELARRVPEARFRMVASPSPQYPDLHRELLLEAAKLANVEILAPRPRSALAELYDRCVAVLNTSEYEGMSNVLLEGWARGVPALVDSHDPDGLVVSEGLGWFAAGSPDRLAQLAAAAWAGRDDQGAIADRCRGYVAREHVPARVAERWERALGLSEPLP